MVAFLLIVSLVTASAQVQPDFQYEVLRSKPLKRDEPGRLQITASGVDYRAVKGKTSIRLPFVDIREMNISDPSVIRIETYEMLKRKLSGRRTYVFRLPSPRAIEENENLVRFLSVKLSRPLLASYRIAAKPEYEIPAYHRHVVSGCNGSIQISPEGIRFLSALEEHSRTWLYSEIKTIGGSDPFSFRLTTLTETYTFDLKQPLPKEAFEVVWRRVYDLPPKYAATEHLPAQGEERRRVQSESRSSSPGS